MYHYLFTNDLRISNLSESLVKAGKCFSTNTVPSANDNKSENNFMNTLGFYFNLTKDSNFASSGYNILILYNICIMSLIGARVMLSFTESVMDSVVRGLGNWNFLIKLRTTILVLPSAHSLAQLLSLVKLK